MTRCDDARTGKGAGIVRVYPPYLVRQHRRARGQRFGTIEGGWTADGYPAPAYDVVYGPDRTTLPVVSADSTGDRTGKAAGRQLNANEQAAFNLAVETGRVTTRGAAEATGLSRQAASALLKRLADRGLLTWHGKSPKDPRQYYTASTDKQGLQ